MRTPFGPSWDDLELPGVEAFFSEPRNESLFWEAKGGKVERDDVRRQFFRFGNSRYGGFLVLGVEQDKSNRDVFHVRGWDPGTEPDLWISSVVESGGVDPIPPYVPLTWPLSATLGEP